MENEKYIFVSYSHKNDEVVQQLVKCLEKSGCNIWYDKGLHVGSEFNKVISDMILGSTVFLSFVTEHYLDSTYCAEEIIYAKNLNKTIINILDVSSDKIPPWYQMRFSNTTHQLFFSDFSSIDRLGERIASEEAVQECINKNSSSGYLAMYKGHQNGHKWTSCPFCGGEVQDGLCTNTKCYRSMLDFNKADTSFEEFINNYNDGSHDLPELWEYIKDGSYFDITYKSKAVLVETEKSENSDAFFDLLTESMQEIDNIEVTNTSEEIFGNLSLDEPRITLCEYTGSIVRIEWDNEDGATCTVVRKQNSPLQSKNDGEIIAQGITSGFYSDSSVSNGNIYYYGVYASKYVSGDTMIESELAAYNGSVCVINDVSGIRQDAIFADHIEVKWNSVGNVDKIIVEKDCADSNKSIPDKYIEETGFFDFNPVGKVTRYTIKCKYLINGVIYTTNGVSFEASKKEVVENKPSISEKLATPQTTIEKTENIQTSPKNSQVFFTPHKKSEKLIINYKINGQVSIKSDYTVVIDFSNDNTEYSSIVLPKMKLVEAKNVYEINNGRMVAVLNSIELKKKFLRKDMSCQFTCKVTKSQNALNNLYLTFYESNVDNEYILRQIVK